MEIAFAKWQGTGNDFILIDDRSGLFPRDLQIVRHLCDRHFGIGSDGLILVQRSAYADYHMEFFNPDGSQSFCGNGSRCAFAFWRSISEGGGRARFTAIDGDHEASVEGDGVRVSLAPSRAVEMISGTVDLVHTGSPHLLVWTEDPGAVDILPEARRYRYSERFKQEGVNVNFVRWHEDHVEMRTYERGVEDETLSCGTGVTAAAIDAIHRGHTSSRSVPVHTRGGILRVEVDMDPQRTITGVHLVGPAVEVFKGSFHL